MIRDTISAEAQASSFYATAWRVNGQDYIAYRGTDVKDVLASSNDIWGGWSIGLGFSAGTQADLAQKFYEAVLAARTSPPSSTSVFAPAPADIHVTGHSLGSGLADQVAADSPG